MEDRQFESENHKNHVLLWNGIYEKLKVTPLEELPIYITDLKAEIIEELSLPFAGAFDCYACVESSVTFSINCKTCPIKWNNPEKCTKRGSEWKQLCVAFDKRKDKELLIELSKIIRDKKWFVGGHK